MSIYELKTVGNKTVASGMFSPYKPRVVFTFLVGY